MIKTLLLNNNYEVLSFINDRKVINLIYKNKVEILSNWNEKITHPNGYILYPAVIKMNYLIKRGRLKLNFSKKNVLRRDNYICKYCSKLLTNQTATVDHIIPKHRGGQSIFLNCVASCYSCNNKKGNRTLEEAGMKLLIAPTIPYGIFIDQDLRNRWHHDWDNYIK